MILQLQNIDFGFSKEKQILKSLSLSLEEHKIYALMGSNGAGKTTILNLITGLLKPQNGDIFFKNKCITNQQPHKINNSGICRTYQDLRLISKLTVYENILLAMDGNPTNNFAKALLPQFVFRKKIKELEGKADEILNEYLLQDVKNNLAGEISYGQQKLLNLACCVSNGALLLLLDEPLVGVNEEYFEVLQEKICNMVLQGKTILLIDHHTDFIGHVAEKIFFLLDGKIHSFNTMEELKNDSKIIEAYIS